LPEWHLPFHDCRDYQGADRSKFRYPLVHTLECGHEIIGLIIPGERFVCCSRCAVEVAKRGGGKDRETVVGAER